MVQTDHLWATMEGVKEPIYYIIIILFSLCLCQVVAVLSLYEVWQVIGQTVDITREKERVGLGDTRVKKTRPVSQPTYFLVLHIYTNNFIYNED